MRLFYMHPFISYQRKPPMFKRGEVQYFLARKQDSSDSTHFYQNPGLLLSRFSLVCCTLSMICLAIFFCYLFCSVFSEFPGSVIWYFSLCLESSWPYTFPTIFSSPSDILITCIFWNALFCFSTLFVFACGLENCYWSIFKLSDSFLSCAHQRHSSFLLVFLISSISFWFFLRASISLPRLPICSCILSTFSFRTFDILNSHFKLPI